MKFKKSKRIHDKIQESNKLDYKDLKFPSDFDFNIIEKRLINFNQIASRRVDQYAHERRISLQINLTILLSLAAIFSTFFNVLNDCLKIIASVFFICYFLLSISNIIYNLSAHKTKFSHRPIQKRIKDFFKKSKIDDYWITPLFYRGNVPNKVNLLKTGLNNFATKFGLKKLENNNKSTNGNDIVKINLLKNEIKNLYILFRYQSNYYRLAKWTRTLTLWGIILVGIGIFVIFICIVFIG